MKKPKEIKVGQLWLEDGVNLYLVIAIDRYQWHNMWVREFVLFDLQKGCVWRRITEGSNTYNWMTKKRQNGIRMLLLGNWLVTYELFVV